MRTDAIPLFTRREHKVAVGLVALGEIRPLIELRGFLVARFANHDAIQIRAQLDIENAPEDDIDDVLICSSERTAAQQEHVKRGIVIVEAEPARAAEMLHLTASQWPRATEFYCCSVEDGSASLWIW